MEAPAPLLVAARLLMVRALVTRCLELPGEAGIMATDESRKRP
jgi:hypothetical protein